VVKAVGRSWPAAGERERERARRENSESE
jgi:hypothetical protein